MGVCDFYLSVSLAVVARAYKKLIEEFKYAFETIEFAIYCSPRDDSNFRIFSDRIKGIVNC